MYKINEPVDFKSNLGPGYITMALAQGSGELIWWPYLVGKYGISFLWLLPIAALAQLPINYFLGRFTITTGESFFEALFKRSKGFASAIWGLFAVSFLWFGAYASAAGTALGTFVWPLNVDFSERTKALTWATIILIISIFIVIKSKKRIYTFIKIFMSIICILTFVLLLLAIIIPDEVRQNYLLFTTSLFPFLKSSFWKLAWWPKSWNPKDWPILISALLFTGMGGFWNVLYSYWAKENRWGVAAKGNNTSNDGNDDDNRYNFRKWLQILKLDVTIGIVGNLITTLFISLLALTYLTKSAELPSGWRLVVVQSKLFTGLGSFGPSLFIIIAVLFLIDFWITTADAVARVHCDALYSIFPSFRKYKYKDRYMYIIYALAIITFITMFITSPQFLFMINGVINAAAMIIVIICIYYLFKKIEYAIPNWSRPGLFGYSFLLLAFIFFLVSFILYLLLS